MTTVSPDLAAYEARVAAYKEHLGKQTIGAVLEIAATQPGGSHDFPNAPIDAAYHAAAMALVSEAGLQEQLTALLTA